MAGDDLTPRSGSRMSRRQREDRGFQLVVVGGVAAAVTVVTAVLAIAGVLGWGLPFLGLVVAAVCALLFRRLASRR
jgi:putative flippase GtrA